MKVCFITFGCRLNRAEALDEEAKYLAAGWELTDIHAEADRFVVRGCSVTSKAQRECEKLIDHLQLKYPNRRIIIQGCLKRATALKVPSMIKRIIKTADDLHLKPDACPIPTRTSRAYLKVQDGCSGSCTFCIVPQFRGNSRSIEYHAVMDKAKRFMDAGYHEIVITGCNLSLYAASGKRLPDLLASLAELGNEHNCRIRLGSIEPGACAMETVHTLAEHANICRFLHLPIQSGSVRILQAMRRPYQIKDVDNVIQEALRLMPNIALGCDLMTGFPDESTMDFLSTKSLLERYPFSNAHIFPYSKRPNTLAAGFLNEVSHVERSKRAYALTKIINEKRNLFSRRFLGRTVEVVIENEDEQAGWTSEYVWFKRSNMALIDNPLPLKSLATFTVTNYRHGHLVG